MSMPSATRYEEGQSDHYHTLPPMVPSSRFLTPPSPYTAETRRDSIVSSQSSISFAGGMSDFPGPVTPTYAQSPMTEEGFLGIMAYNLDQESQSQMFHGLPMSYQPKLPGADQSLYSLWKPMPHSPELNNIQLMPFQSQVVLPPSGDFLQNTLAGDIELDMATVAMIDPPWSNLSTAAHAGIGKRWNDPTVREENMQVFWINQMQQAQSIQMQSVIPSGPVADVGNDDAHVEAEQFIESRSFDSYASSFPPSPQEISYKIGNSLPVKHEPDTAVTSPRLKRSIYVSPTGGKSVKKERRAGTSSKKRSKIMKRWNRQSSFNVNGIDTKLDGVEFFKDEETGEYRLHGTRQTNAKKRCEHVDKMTGLQCTKHFVRPEHLKRHEQTHSGERNYHCAICGKQFNRNDNCQEHYWTHVRRPGKKYGRNNKMSLAEVESFCTDPLNGPKLIEKLRQKWKNELEV